jgi:signal transduction histidine kinase/ActR/RegA family two-component response regulator
MTARLEHEGNIYGMLCASMPESTLLDTDEIALFEEVANDIAFALHDISLEAEHELLLQERLRSDKLESISTLAGGIAHDFNNLLTGIMGNIGLAKTYADSPEKASEALEEAEKAAMRARDLTQQLLTFARGGKPVKKTIDIARLIEESATFALRGSSARLALSLPDDLWSTEVDAGQMNQVINNLVINADEAMPAGGTVSISGMNSILKKISALPLPGGRYVRIDIHDTGVGIATAHLQRIFEPYFTTKKKGSGLGLSSAYSIIRNHGGYILAESTKNKGTTFHIYLPASRKAARMKKEPKQDKPTAVGGRILVMDDDEVIRKMLNNMLHLAGYEAITTSNGDEALGKYTQALKTDKPFDAVIMDLTIPGGMGGKETITELRKIDPGARVIVSSGYATDPIMSEYRKYGFSAVIAKPYSVKQLEETLQSLLKKQEVK